jgi:hypothetical protein
LKKDSWVEGAGALGWVEEPRPCEGGLATVLLLDALAAGLPEDEAVALSVGAVAVSTRDTESEELFVEASDEELSACNVPSVGFGGGVSDDFGSP